MHINTQDLVLRQTSVGPTQNFQWVERPENKEERYIYGEISVTANITTENIMQDGVCVTIPYTPIHKEIRVRIKRSAGTPTEQYVINQANGTEWFEVVKPTSGQTTQTIYASELFAVSEDLYHLSFGGEKAHICSGWQTDFSYVNANQQNKNMMLLCNPGNNYRYPLTGVGLIRYINSSISTTDLAEVLQREFTDDKTPVREASFNQETNELILTLDTTTTDHDG